METSMLRRDFILACGAWTLTVSFPATPAGASARFYSRALLVDPAGRPLEAGALPENRNFIFHYPFAGTPCFLLNLGKPTKPSAQLKTADEQTYEWAAGVGAGHSIVAYSAICAHRLTYPTREISFISYPAEESAGSRFAQVIHCCSEHSQYDPAEGAKVLAGPAPQPLAAVLLEHDPTSDGLFAVGTLGGELFNEFFSKYEFRLALDHGGHHRPRGRTPRLMDERAVDCRLT